MKKHLLICCLLLSVHFNWAQTTDPVKIMHYNLLNFGNDCNVSLNDKDDWLRTILDHVGPDILTVNEIGNSEAFANRIRSRGFPAAAQMAYGEFYVNSGSSITNAIFYNRAKFSVLNRTIIADFPRDITIYSLDPIGDGFSAKTLHLIIAHWKASDGQQNISIRETSANKVMNWIKQNAEGENVIFLGDLNISNANEGSFKLLVNNADPSINLVDPTGYDDGWGAARREVLTQSTRLAQPSDCGVGGGLDDRFDFILMSEAFFSGANGALYIENSFETIGNDGRVFNSAMNCDINTSVPMEVCESLFNMSDHLPISIELDLATNRSEKLSGIKIALENPVSDQISIDIKDNYSGAKDLTFKVYSPMGRMLLSQSHNASSNSFIKLPFHHYPAGMYLLTISDRQGRSLHKKLLKL